MKPLFTHKITTGRHEGKDLVGFDNADKYLKNNVILKPYWPMIGGFLNEFYPKYDPEIKVISTISDITEEQTKELGFSSFDILLEKIYEVMGPDREAYELEDLSNILLILVTP